jgi:hypothetical protein
MMGFIIMIIEEVLAEVQRDGDEDEAEEKVLAEQQQPQQQIEGEQKNLRSLLPTNQIWKLATRCGTKAVGGGRGRGREAG